MKEVKYNPFGSTENEYSYNSVRKSSSSPVKWKYVVLFFILTSLVVSYAVIFVAISQMKKETDAAIDTFNQSLFSVHNTMSDPALTQDLRSEADKTQELIGGENERIKATRLLSNVTGNLPESAPEYDKNGTTESEALKLAPYYALCDISAYSLKVPSMDYIGLCQAFTQDAQNMMTFVQRYNSLSSSFLGAITFHNETYADVTAGNGLTQEESGQSQVQEESAEPPAE